MAKHIESLASSASDNRELLHSGLPLMSCNHAFQWIYQSVSLGDIPIGKTVLNTSAVEARRVWKRNFHRGSQVAIRCSHRDLEATLNLHVQNHIHVPAQPVTYSLPIRELPFQGREGSLLKGQDDASRSPSEDGNPSWRSSFRLATRSVSHELKGVPDSIPSNF